MEETKLNSFDCFSGREENKKATCSLALRLLKSSIDCENWLPCWDIRLCTYQRNLFSLLPKTFWGRERKITNFSGRKSHWVKNNDKKRSINSFETVFVPSKLDRSTQHLNEELFFHHVVSDLRAKPSPSNDYGVFLNPDELPRKWYNIVPDLPEKLAPMLNPHTLEPLSPKDFEHLFPKELVRQ